MLPVQAHLGESKDIERSASGTNVGEHHERRQAATTSSHLLTRNRHCVPQQTPLYALLLFWETSSPTDGSGKKREQKHLLSLFCPEHIGIKVQMV